MNTMFSTHAVRLAYGRTLMDGGSSLLTSSSYAVGTWVDNDCIVFDVSEKVAHSRSAYELCKERNEDAYYDVEASKSVFIEKDNDNA